MLNSAATERPQQPPFAQQDHAARKNGPRVRRFENLDPMVESGCKSMIVCGYHSRSVCSIGFPDRGRCRRKSSPAPRGRDGRERQNFGRDFERQHAASAKERKEPIVPKMLESLSSLTRHMSLGQVCRFVDGDEVGAAHQPTARSWAESQSKRSHACFACGRRFQKALIGGSHGIPRPIRQRGTRLIADPKRNVNGMRRDSNVHLFSRQAPSNWVSLIADRCGLERRRYIFEESARAAEVSMNDRDRIERDCDGDHIARGVSVLVVVGRRSEPRFGTRSSH